MQRLEARLAAAALAIAALASPASAPHAKDARSVTGTWRGSYVCAQGPTGLTLSIDRQSGADFSGFFHFYPPRGNPAAKEGCFAVTGHLDADGGATVRAGRWITRPFGYVTVDLAGRLDPSGLSMAGDVAAPPEYGALCRRFEIDWHGRRAKAADVCREAGLQVLHSGELARP